MAEQPAETVEFHFNYREHTFKKAAEKRRVTEAECEAAREYFEGLGANVPLPSQKLAAFQARISARITAKRDKEGKMIAILSNNQIEQYCEENGILFNDWEFPPSDDIMYKRADTSKELPVEKRPPVVWQRPFDFIDEPRLFSSKGISTADCKQGALGDCWLLCCFAAYAEFPPFVKSAFPGGERISPVGSYQVKLFKEGQEELIQLDDYIPVNMFTNGPVFSRSTSGLDLWVCLLEKAFAKYNGSYGAISTGKPFEGLLDLSGCPYYEYRFSSKVVQNMMVDYGVTCDLHDRLVQYDKEGYLMTCKTPGVPAPTFEENCLPTGLVPGHAYTIVAAIVLADYSRICLLRNPWGSFSWKGKWGPDCPNWNFVRRQEMSLRGHENPSELKNGLFWMGWEDLCTHFNDISVVCCFNPIRPWPWVPKVWNVERRSLWFTHNPGSKYGMRIDSPQYENELGIFKLTVQEKAKFYFSAHQKDMRVLGTPPYIDIGVTVLKQKGSDFDYVISTGCTAERQIQCEVDNLAPGDYFIVPTSTGTKIQQLKALSEAQSQDPVLRRSGGLVVHSLGNFNVTNVEKNVDPKLLDWARLCALEKHCTEGPTSTTDPLGDGSLILNSFRCGYAGHTYGVMNFTHQKQEMVYYEVTMDMTRSINTLTSTGSLLVTLVVAPGEYEIPFHCFPDAVYDGSFTCFVESLIRRMAEDEINRYLADNPDVATRVNQRKLEKGGASPGLFGKFFGK